MPVDTTAGNALTPGTQTPFGPIVGQGEFGLPQGLGLAWHTALLSEISAMMGADGYVRRRNPTTGVWEKTAERTEGALARIADEAYRNAQKGFQEAALTGTYNGQETQAAKQIREAQDNWTAQMGWTREEGRRRLGIQLAGLQTEATGFVHTVDNQGNVTRTSQLTTSEQGRQALLALQTAAQTGVITIPGAPGTAPRQLTMQGRAAKLAEAAQKTQDTGQVHVVTDAGVVVPSTNADGTPLLTTSEQGRQAQLELQQAAVTGTYDGAPTLAALAQQSQARQALVAEALSQSQQTGQVYRVKADGTGIEQARDVSGNPIQTTSEQGRLFTQQLQQAAATGVLAGQATVAGRAALADQALQQSQTTGYAYQVNAAGTGIEPVLRNGQQIRTESAEGRLATQALEQQKLGQQATQFTASQAQQASQFSRTAAQQEAARLTEATGQVYSVAGAGTTDDPFRAIPAGTAGATGAAGVAAAGTSPAFVAPAGTQTLAARAQLFQQAIQRGTETGYVHTVNEQGQVVPQTDAQGNQVRTDSSQGRLFQQQLATRAQAESEAERRSRDTGQLYTVDASGQPVLARDASGNPIQTQSAQAQAFQQGIQAAGVTGTYQGQLTLAAKQQSRDAALARAANLTQQTGNVHDLVEQPDGTFTVQQVVNTQTGLPLQSTTEQGRLFQQGRQAQESAWAQANQLTQASGFIYDVVRDAQGNLVPRKTEVQTESAQGRQFAQQLEQQRLDETKRQFDTMQTGYMEATGQTAENLTAQRDQTTQALQRASAAPDRRDPQTGRTVQELQGLQGRYDSALNEMRTSGTYTDPHSGQRVVTLQRSMQELNAAILRAEQSGSFVDPVTGQASQTLKAQKQNADLALQAAGLTGEYVDPTTGQRRTTLAGQQQAFTQQQAVAQLAANPRNYIEAAMLGRSRGGLGGFAPANQLNATTPAFVAPAAATVGAGAGQGAQAQSQQADRGGEVGPAIMQTPQYQALEAQYQQLGQAGDRAGADRIGVQLQQMLAPAAAARQQQGGPIFQAPQAQSQGQAGPLGVPGAPDHVATLEGAGGNRLHYFASSTAGADVPVTAATRALMDNRAVPGFGAISGPSGGYANQQQLTAAFRPNQIRFQDYARLAPSEQEQTKAVASLAGYDPADFEAQMRRASTPQFRSPSVGRLM